MQQYLKGVNLSEAVAVLVRFHYTNEKIIPRGLRSIERQSEQELIKKRMNAMQVDSASKTYGRQVLHNIERVQVAVLRVGLANNGLRLVDGHTFDEKMAGRKTKYITSLGFRRLNDGEVAPEIPAEAMTDLRDFATNAVWTAHVWWNPNGVMIVELMMRQPGGVPQYAIVIRDGWIVAAPTERLLEENEEDMQIGALLLEELKSLRVA